MTTSSAPKASASPAEVRPVFRVRYGRTAIALVALAGLLTAVVAGVLATFALAPLWLPVTSAVVTVLSFVSLRRLAVRDRKAKAAARRAAERAAASPVMKASEGASAPRKEAVKAETSTPSAPQREEKVFDAEASAPKRTALTAVELRQAALAVAAEAGDVPAALESAPVEQTWEPVEVPKPTYVDAAKAERPAPKPLEMPEAPKPTAKTSIKQTAPAKAPAPVKAKPETTAAKPTGAKNNSALNNLDDVLQRRRA